MASALTFSFASPPKDVMEFKAGNISYAFLDDFFSKSELADIRLYSYDWTIKNYSMIKSVCAESSSIAGPSFLIGPAKNLEFQPLLRRNSENLKIEFQLTKETNQSEERKAIETSCSCSLSLKHSRINLDLEFIDSSGKIIDFYKTLPSELILMDTKKVVSWTKEENVSRFINEDTLTMRAKLSFKYFSNKSASFEDSKKESIKVFKNDMKNLFNDRSRFTDIVVKVGGQFIVAHKAVLYTQYPGFAEIVKLAAESDAQNQDVLSKLPTSIRSVLTEDHDILCIPNEKDDVFTSVLHYIYCRKLMKADFSVDDFAVYKFAEKYRIRELSMRLFPTEIKVHSAIEVEKVNYTWYVKKFSSISKGFTPVQSPSFSCGNDGRITWCLLIYRLDPENVVLNLQRNSDLDLDIQTTFKLAVCKPDNSIHDEIEYKHLFAASTISNSHPGLMNSVSGTLITPDLLYNDTLTVRCDLSVSTGGILSRQKLIYPAEYPRPDLAYWTNNFKNLLEKGNFSDATLMVGDKEFKIHKVVLSARSPVFARMFESDMEEKRSGCVKIEDISELVMEKALHYIYTGEFPDLTMEHAPELFRTADKYEIMDLKLRCSEFILKNLDVGSSCEILILADLYNDEKIKKAAKKLICQNAASTLLSPRGMELITNYPRLAHDILESLSVAFCALPPQDVSQNGESASSKDYVRHRNRLSGVKRIVKPNIEYRWPDIRYPLERVAVMPDNGNSSNAETNSNRTSAGTESVPNP